MLKKNIVINRDVLLKMQTELQSRNKTSFDLIITQPLRSPIQAWIKKEYPSLINETEDLITAVIRRMRNEVLRINPNSDSLDVYDLAYIYTLKECSANLPTELNKRKNLGLTKAEFRKLVQELQEGKETIIEKFYLAQFEQCKAILINKTNCNSEVAADCILDALLEIRGELLKNKLLYGNLSSYFTTKVINQFFRNSHNKKPKTEALENNQDLKDGNENKDQLIEQELKYLVRESIKKLCKECQEILKKFYYDEKDMMEIAAEMNKSYEAIRKQASRCRAKLKNYISANFYQQYKHFFNS